MTLRIDNLIPRYRFLHIFIHILYNKPENFIGDFNGFLGKDDAQTMFHLNQKIENLITRKDA